MDTKLMKQIKDILSEFPRYWDGEDLQRTIVIEDLKRYDAMLISSLLRNKKIKEVYSVQAGDVVIFKVQEFIDLLRYKDYWADSYTKYSNTIGLSSEGKYLQYNTDVVLDFPYKDCVLEAGMTKEDTGKDETFYNEVIARDEIDTLLAPKVFVNAKMFDFDGEHKVDFFSDEDNLIIKGNNLLALHSLNERYAGKVKLIYIDPPYNTGGDSFKYNDNFNHSTWLTFMRNRVAIAKKLLQESGSIWIHIDDNELAYLKVICDEVFGSENFINFITLKTKTAGVSGSSEGKSFIDSTEYIIVYAKEKSKFSLNESYISKPLIPLIEDYATNGKSWKYTTVYTSLGERKYYKTIKDGSGNDIKIFKHEKYSTSSISKIMKEQKLTLEEAHLKYFDRICTTENAQTSIRTRVQEATKDSDGLFSIEYYPISGKNKKKLTTVFFTGNKKRLVSWLKNISYIKDNKLYKQERISTLWDSINWNNVNKEGGVNFPNGQKPESLIKLILELGTTENDLVLDFFMATATTQAVSMKMNRKFLGIEQMDYIESLAVARLKNVIEGEQSGISKEVDWKGGGSFIYAELMELNQTYMDKIDQTSNEEELINLWSELDNNADLNFQLDKEKLTDELLKARDEEEGSLSFNDLTFEEQKEIFKKALDKNRLYVNYSEIEDEENAISENDKKFNYSFYETRGEV